MEARFRSLEDQLSDPSVISNQNKWRTLSKEHSDLGEIVTLYRSYKKVDKTCKGVKTLNITDKTGKLVAIKSVTDGNDLMIINKSGITIRLKVAEVRIMGRATQGVRLINLEKRNDQIGSVCKVTSEEEEITDENSNADFENITEGEGGSITNPDLIAEANSEE